MPIIRHLLSLIFFSPQYCKKHHGSSRSVLFEEEHLKLVLMLLFWFCRFFFQQENFLTALCEKVRPCAENNRKRSLDREAQPARDAGSLTGY